MRGKIQINDRKILLRILNTHGWTVFKVGSGKFVRGWPDYYCYHHQHGHRWIETKAKGEKLTPAQLDRFQKLSNAGDNIFVLETYEHYGRLFEKENWRAYQRGAV